MYGPYGPNELLAGAAMMAEIPCPVCKKFERWETYVEPTSYEDLETIEYLGQTLITVANKTKIKCAGTCKAFVGWK